MAQILAQLRLRTTFLSSIVLVIADLTWVALVLVRQTVCVLFSGSCLRPVLLLLRVVASLFGIRLRVLGSLSGNLGVLILAVCLIALTSSVSRSSFCAASALGFAVCAIVRVIKEPLSEAPVDPRSWRILKVGLLVQDDA